jgi:hypothetical protein
VFCIFEKNPQNSQQRSHFFLNMLSGFRRFNDCKIGSEGRHTGLYMSIYVWKLTVVVINLSICSILLLDGGQK